MTRPQKLAANLLILAVLYFSTDAILYTCNIRLPAVSFNGGRGPLPSHWLFTDLFNVFGVFASWTNYNLLYSAWGSGERLATSPQEPLDSMIDLNLYEYFPQLIGDAHRRIRFHNYRRNAKLRAYRWLAATLQQRHNARHPEHQVAQVFIFWHRFPKSAQSYASHFEQATTGLLGHN